MRRRSLMSTSARSRSWAVPAWIAIVLVTGACSGHDGGGSAPSGGSSAPSAAAGGPTGASVISSTAPAGSAPPVATDKPSVAISRAPVVKVGKPAHILSDVRVYIGEVREVTVTAEHPGEIKGDAAAVGVSVRNQSGQAFSLDGMVVTASYHNGLPGDQTTSGPSDPLTGSLASGKTATGTYVFMVPRKYAYSLRIEVTSNQSPTIVQFAR
jgi:hypothetical protein